MSDNPLDDSNEERQQLIRERAYHLWEADGRPDDREAEYWDRARVLVGMEQSPHAGELPNPASLPGADPNRVGIVEEAFLEENLGEFPNALSDQGERPATPSKANLKP